MNLERDGLSFVCAPARASLAFSVASGSRQDEKMKRLSSGGDCVFSRWLPRVPKWKSWLTALGEAVPKCGYEE